MNNTFKNIIVWLLIGFIFMAIFNQFADIQNKSVTVDYSSFLQDVKNGSVQKVVIDGRVLTVLNSEGNKYVVYAPSDPWLVSDLPVLVCLFKRNLKKSHHY